ncbi:MAG: hypothetical protein JSW10_04760 [Pseudomonadota bacterium]|nr:MAG: hypothetical protein JSW10_04760 [Pseudomonadota bacterium]
MRLHKTIRHTMMVVGACAGATLTACSEPQDAPTQSTETSPTSTRIVAVPANAPAMRAYKDPETGEFVAGPPQGVPQADFDEAAALRRPTTPKMTTLPDGTVMVEINSGAADGQAHE